MSSFLTDAVKSRLAGGEKLVTRLPVPWTIPSNGEFTPPPPSPLLRQYRAVYADYRARAMARWPAPAAFDASNQAMAGAFAAFNAVAPDSFTVERLEAEDRDCADASRAAAADQFVFDDHVHFLREDADPAHFGPFLGMIDWTADALDLPAMKERVLERIGFAGFVKDIYLDSDTDIALLSGAPADADAGWLLTNDMMALTRETVNAALGGPRLLSHAVFAPGRPGWLDEIDRAHADLAPDSWKGYTIGDAFAPSGYRWRMDDEMLVYPAYERMVRAGVTTVCVHKGILPADAEVTMPGAEPFARVDDVGKAAHDWPQLDFVIYHAGYRTAPQPTEREVAAFEATGRIDWVSDLAAIPSRWGVSNVYADIGASFAFTVLTHPRLAAGMLGILINGLGTDHVLWGTDSVWFGSPQWQIEAFRRLVMPADLQKRFGFPDLGPATGALRTAVLGSNGAKLYGLSTRKAPSATDATADRLKGLRDRYLAAGGGRSDFVYGYVDPAAIE